MTEIQLLTQAGERRWLSFDAAWPTNKPHVHFANLSIDAEICLLCEPSKEARQQAGLDFGKKSVAVHVLNGNGGLLETGTFIWVIKQKPWVTYRKWGAVGSAWRVITRAR